MTTTLVAEQPGISPRESAELGAAMSDALVSVLSGLSEAQWETTTRCAPWTIKDMVGHMLAWGEALTSVRELGSQARRALGRMKEYGNIVDAQNSIQVDDRRHLSGAQILARFQEHLPAEIRARKRFGTALRYAPFYLPYVGGATNLGYLFNTIFLRDLLVHRLDIAAALGTEPRPTDADERVAVDMLKDWARRTTADVQVVDGDTAYVAGAGIETIEAPLPHVIEVLAGRRDPATVSVKGDRGRVETWLARGVPI